MPRASLLKGSVAMPGWCLPGCGLVLTEAPSGECAYACIMSIRYDDTLTGNIPEEGTKHILFWQGFLPQMA